jgi:uridylate kinase
MNTGKKFVINLGGSIVCPKDINVDFLKKFCFFIKNQVSKGNKFIIVVGGGKIARQYQEAASKISRVSDNNKDWLGILATRLNSYLLSAILEKQVNPVFFNKRYQVKEFGKYPVIIGSGWKPGWSTDFVSCQIACDFSIKQVIILGKPDYVYTTDFVKDRTAKPIKEITWQDYFKLIPKEWSPGLHAPVDPVAARLSKKNNLQVIVSSAKDLNNVSKILQNKKFKGTIIRNKLL